MFVTLRNHLITYMYSYKILRSVQINIEKIWGEYSNKAERSTVRGMRYIYTLIASKIHLMTGKIFTHYCLSAELIHTPSVMKTTNEYFVILLIIN